jgi:cytochrome c-type biogenesis protein CcmH
MKKLLVILVLLITPFYSLWAAEDYYHFATAIEQQRFQHLTSELRCLVCQNQNLAESNAALASDLRQQIYTKIQEGQSNQQIIDYLVTRYGDFILYSPPLTIQTIGLWFGPVILLLAGLAYLFYYLRKNQEPSSEYNL